MSPLLNNSPAQVQLFVWDTKYARWAFDCEADNREEYRSLLAVKRHYEREGKLIKIEGELK